MANENQNTNTNPGLNLNQQSLDLQNLRQGLKDLLDDQGDYNNLLKSSLKDLEKTSTQYKKIQDRLSSLSKESINIKEINQELYKLKQKESDEQKKLTQLQSLYGKQTVSSLENAKKRALEDKKLYESQGISFDLQKQILSNLQEQGNLEAVKIFTQQKQLDFAKQKTIEGQLALENEKNLAKQLGLTGNSAEVLAKKLNIGKEAYATMVAEARKLLEEQKTLSQSPQQKVLNNPSPVKAQAQAQQTTGQAQAQQTIGQAQAQAQQTIGQAQAQAQQIMGQAQAQAQQIMGQVQAQASQTIGQAQAQAQQMQAQNQAQQTIGQAQAQAQQTQAQNQAQQTTTQTQAQAQQIIKRVQAKAQQTTGQAQAQAQQIIMQAQTQADQIIGQAQAQAQQTIRQGQSQNLIRQTIGQAQAKRTTSPNKEQTTGPNKERTRQTIFGVQEIKKDQGDYNDILKDSINLLKKVDRSYENIEARVSSLDKSQINIKQISNELYKAKQKDYIVSKQLAEAEKTLSADSLNRVSQYVNSQKKISELEKRKFEYEKLAIATSDTAEKKKIEDKIANTDRLLQLNIVANERQKAGLSIQEAQVVALKEADSIAKEGVAFGERSLDIEKQTAKQLGISGNLVSGLATKLGVGTEAYEAMTTEARRLVEEDKKRKTLQEQLAEAQKSGNTDQVKSLNEQLALMGKEKSAFSKKTSVLKEGFKAGKAAIKDSLSDPLAKGGLAIGAFKLAEAGLDGIGNGAAKAGNFLAGMSKHSGTIVRDLTSGVTDLIRKIPLVGGLLGGLVDGFAAVLDLMLGVDDHAVKIGRQLNLSAGAARGLARSYREMSITNGDIFITAEKMLESQAELANSLGITNNLGSQILAKNIKLKEFAGLELDTRTKLAETTKISGQDATNAVLAQVVGLKKVTGISFQYQAILKEAAGQSGYLGLQFAKYPAQLTKSLLTVKSMGMELKQLESIADSFLDFESSISKEFEAQLLTGKEINLTKAREAFLNNDLATAAAEITKQVGSTEDFLKLNRIQADSLASAFGMSRDQMGEMLKQQELLAKLGAKQGDSAREQLRLGLEKYKNEEALSAAIGEQAYQSMVNASTQEKLAAMIEKIKESIVSFVMESKILDKVTAFIDYISEPKNVRAILQQIKGFFADAVEFIGTAAHYILEGLDYIAFGQIPDEFIDSIKSGAITMGEQIRSFGEGGMQENKSNVSESAAKDKLKSEGSSKKEDNSMSMAKAPIIHNTNNITVEPVTAKVMVNTITKEGSQDNTPGQMHTGQ
jgi:hypothetical protein